MRSIDEEFEKYDKKVREEEKRYANSETKWKDYNFPHIYLSDKDIKEFNNKCVELGIDLKVVPIAEYMNLNKPEKKEDNNDEEKMDDKMEKIDKAMEHLSKNFFPDKKKKLNLIKDNSYIINEVNDYIGKKQRRIADNHSEEENNNNSNSLSKEDEKDQKLQSVSFSHAPRLYGGSAHFCIGRYDDDRSIRRSRPKRHPFNKGS